MTFSNALFSIFLLLLLFANLSLPGKTKYGDRHEWYNEKLPKLKPTEEGKVNVAIKRESEKFSHSILAMFISNDLA